ncbi:zinc finger domain-containing protein [Fusarium austroafricanum]|uniref:Zinc finger domain-containing protein n=1 Tax=Fusarium austroafricanum TaxID=2364996 RepID=A0A8H4NEV6_9HYPO|nr:zinc finger domain-containing protein [Fusarium austroafricanum]
MEGPRVSPVERLPVEITQKVLSTVTDLLSLRCAALSCPAFFYAFNDAENAITTRVLSTQVGFDLLPEAIAASESSQLPSHTEEEIQEFVANHLRRRRSPPESWTLALASALPIGKFHNCVSAFARMFVSNVSIRENLGRVGWLDPTYDETCRIERALYRFEVFRNILSKSRSIEEETNIFFANFAPWENEQLGCIHDFLVRAVSPAFDDVAEHDIAWGELRVEYGVGIESPYIQHLLYLGLEKLHQIITAETYEARHKLLNDRRFSCPRTRFDFLYDALDNVNEPDDTPLLLSDFTQEDERSHIRPPFFNDPDSGPAEIWRWAHQDETQQQFVYQKSRGPLREWGYVMWDSRRLHDLGILQKPFDSEGAWNASRLDLDQEGRHGAEMAMSWEARSKIYMAGGRGWWSVGDDSKIVWKGGKTPHQRPYTRAHTKPISVEDARDTLQMMKLPSSVTKFLDRQGT